MMDKYEERSLPYTSTSAVTFSSQIDENDSESKSPWNPNWSIQREVSITMEYILFIINSYFTYFIFSKSINESTKICSKKIQILFGIAICTAFILSIILPLLISLTDPFLPPKS